MPDSRPVLHDPTGRRKRAAWSALVALGSITAIFSTLFVLSLLAAPYLPGFAGPHHRRPQWLPSAARRGSEASLISLRREIDRRRSVKKLQPPKQERHVMAAFYAPWEYNGTASLRLAAPGLTHVCPAWLELTPNGRSLDFRFYNFDDNPQNREVESVARANGVRIMPLLSNASGEEFDAKRVERLLADPAAQSELMSEVISWLEEHKYDGLNLDFEQVPSGSVSAYAKFVSDFGARLHAAGLELSADLEASLSPEQLAAFAEPCDWVVVMLYDEHSSSDAPGPIASLEWAESKLDQALGKVPESKLVIGLGSYGYDWTAGVDGADSLSFEEAMATAAGYNDEETAREALSVDENSMNATFEYDDDAGKRHTVWLLDGPAVFNEWTLGQQAGVRGAALWALGTEDPSIWSFLDSRKMGNKPSAAGLASVTPAYAVDFVGKGEILRVSSMGADGKRKLEMDPDSGLATDWIYESYPLPMLIARSGFEPKSLVLTFDDGPDPEYTPEILDVLKQLDVKATFFVVGQNAQTYPDLIHRIVDEGHELGSHSFTHPNLGAVSRERIELELNATQRAIQSITGRSTLLFRPPYNADSRPNTREEVAPLIEANKLGYYTVGESTDPQDWNLTVRNPDGTTRKKTARDIVDGVLSDLKTNQDIGEPGTMILLHDAGGDRSATVEALKLLVPKLRGMGYRFTTVGGLLGKQREDVMPRLGSGDVRWLGVDRAVFWTWYWIERLLTLAFLAAIVLGLARAVLMITLAGLARRREVPATVSPGPTVSCLIAAYNEEGVIVKTIESVLESVYPLAEILVVDDGSSDGTGEVVELRFSGDQRVRVIGQPNSGKAAALNAATQAASGEVIFCIDADTHLDTKAVGLLAQHFADPNVAAVAGSVQVGNVRNLLTRWQALEYTSAQNLDRRAYALLNCITVVPGAIGAWRKSAVLEAGGYRSDTLAEDMDLTWRLREAGYRIANEPEACAYTEAPESWRAFTKQRFRWAFGTLQCLVKHRRSLFRHGWFGWFALPSLWLFQVFAQLLAPLVDLKVLWAIGSVLVAHIGSAAGSLELRDAGVAAAELSQVLVLYALFFTVELAAAWIAYSWERKPKGDLWFLFLQRLAYRQMMYGVLVKSVWRGITGGRTGWGKLQRMASVTRP